MGLARLSLFLLLVLALLSTPVFAQDDSVRVITAHSTRVRSVIFSPDGKYIISSGSDNTIKIWRYIDGTLIRTLAGHTNSVNSVAISTDGTTIASGSSDKTVKIWNLSNGALIHTLFGHTDIILTVAITPEGSKVVSAGNDRDIRVWNINDGRLIYKMSGHSQVVNSVAATPDGSKIVSGSADCTIRIWKMADGTNTLIIQNYYPSASYCHNTFAVTVTPDGSKIISGSIAQSLWYIGVWNINNGDGIRFFFTRSNSIYGLAVTSDSSRIIAGHGKSITTFQISDGSQQTSWIGHSLAVNSVCLIADGSALVSGADDGTARVWNRADHSIRTLQGHTESVYSVDITSDGLNIVSGGWDHTFRIWRASDGTLLRTLTGIVGQVRAIVITPDRSKIISAGDDKMIYIRDFSTGTLLQTLAGHTNYVYCIDVTPNGAFIVSGSYDNSIRIWSVVDGSLIRVLMGHTDYVLTVAVSEDGSKIISGSSDKTIKIWHLSSGTLLRTLNGHISSVTKAVGTYDNTKIVSGSSDKTIKIWDSSSGALLNTLIGHDETVFSLAFTPDGSKLVTSSGDKTIRVWNMDDGSFVRSFMGHTKTVNEVVVSPDGSTLLSASVDKSIKLWSLGPNEGYRSRSRSRSRSRLSSPFLPTSPRKISIVTLLYTSKSERMGFQVAFMNQLAILSVPYCVNPSDSCDGGYLLTYQQSNYDWVFFKKFRNPYTNGNYKFGSVMEVFGDILAISVPDLKYGNNTAGGVTVMKWDDLKASFVRQASLRPKGITKPYGFGKSIAMQLGLIAVGSPSFNTTRTINSGRVYIFRNDTVRKWKPIPTYINSPLQVANEFFGSAISFKDTETIAVANRPSVTTLQVVYVFQYDGEYWPLMFTVSDKSKLGFGWRIMFIQNLLYVSAPNDGTILPNAGSINVYNLKTFGQFELVNTIKPTQTIINEKFGFSFDTDGVKLIVGTKSCDEGQLCGTKGAAYVFSKSKTDWIEQRRFDNGLGDGSDGFGFDVAIKGANLLVSAPFDSAKGIRKGAVYFLKN